MDSTGVKVYGEGEWKDCRLGVGKRRTWFKLLLCGTKLRSKSPIHSRSA